MEDKEKLDRLHDVVIVEFLAMLPEEVMDFTKPEDLESVKSNLADAVARVGRARLARAKAAVAEDARRPRLVGLTGGAEALRAARANDPEFDKKLSLAARKGGESYEADRASIEEDLDELAQWQNGEDPA